MRRIEQWPLSNWWHAGWFFTKPMQGEKFHKFRKMIAEGPDWHWLSHDELRMRAIRLGDRIMLEWELKYYTQIARILSIGNLLAPFGPMKMKDRHCWSLGKQKQQDPSFCLHMQWQEMNSEQWWHGIYPSPTQFILVNCQMPWMCGVTDDVNDWEQCQQVFCRAWQLKAWMWPRVHNF